MNKLILAILKISILSSLLGCAFSTSKMIRNNEVDTILLSEENLKSNYAFSLSDRDRSTVGLWNLLYSNNSRYGYGKVEDHDRKHVNLQLINEKTILASLYHDNEFIDEIYLKGKTKGNYFIVKRNYRLIPFPPIIYIRNEVRTVIANSDSGDLILIQGVANEGWILFMAGGMRRVNHYSFEKID